ncbi:MAG TPA: hypothetical protein VF075_12715 [Pyrinomonadaceae bacterium]
MSASKEELSALLEEIRSFDELDVTEVLNGFEVVPVLGDDCSLPPPCAGGEKGIHCHALGHPGIETSQPASVNSSSTLGEPKQNFTCQQPVGIVWNNQRLVVLAISIHTLVKSVFSIIFCA